jgi:hypothetical protein
MGTSEEKDVRPGFSLSRRAVPAAKSMMNMAKSHCGIASGSRKRQRSRAMLELPLPSFSYDSELLRLEKEFLGEPDDKPSCGLPQRNEMRKDSQIKSIEVIPKPKYGDTIDDSSGDENDDVFATPAFKQTTKAEQAKEMRHSEQMDSSAKTEIQQSSKCILPAKHSSHLPPKSFPFSDPIKEKRNEQSGDLRSIINAIDQCYRKANLSSVTLKQILNDVEDMLSVSLTTAQRTLCKTRIVELIQRSSPFQKESASSPQQSKPSLPTDDHIQTAVEDIFAHSDLTCTLKDVIAAVETRIGMALPKAARKRVKDRVVELVHQSQVKNQDIQKHMTCFSNESVDSKIGETAISTLVSRQARQSVSEPPENNSASIEPVEAGQKVDKEDICKEYLDPLITDQKKLSSGAPWHETKQCLEIKLPSKHETSDTKVNDVMEENKPEVLTGSKREPGKLRMNKADSDTAAALWSDDIPPKQKGARGRKRVRASCNLCSKCSCSTSENDVAKSTLDLSQSDPSIERALIRRLQKLEQMTEKYADQEDGVRRRLKKHRREMWKTRQALIDFGENRPRFLPDVQEIESRFGQTSGGLRLTEMEVDRARSNMFSFAPTFQPTLTQLMGSTTKDEVTTKMFSPHGLLESIVEVDNESPTANETHSAEHFCSMGSDSSLQETTGSAVGDRRAPFVASSPTAGAHRVDWECRRDDRNAASPRSVGMSLWGKMLRGNFRCTWDRLFDEPCETENVAIESLLNYLEDYSTWDATEENSVGGTESPAVDRSMLSQRGQMLADEVVDRIERDKCMVKILEEACPRWKENVAYVMFQNEVEDVRRAMEQVQESKNKLLRVKHELLHAVSKKETVLSVFEDCLTQSLRRFEETEAVQEGFLLSQSSESRRQRSVLSEQIILNERRMSVEGEVMTLMPSHSQTQVCSGESQVP